jgi:hypothetical protein
MRNQQNKAKIATTISPEDKAFLEHAGFNASTALAMGVMVLKNAARDSGEGILAMKPAVLAKTKLFIPIAQLGIADTAPKDRGNPPWGPLFASMEEFQAAKKRVEDFGWKSPEDVRKHFAMDISEKNAVEEARDEEDQDIP